MTDVIKIEDIQNGIEELVQMVKNIETNLSIPKGILIRNKFENRGRKKFIVKTSPDGTIKKLTGIEHTMHDDVRLYYNKYDELVGKMIFLEPENAVLSIRMCNKLKLPVNFKFIPNLQKFSDKFMDYVMAKIKIK